MTQCGLHFRALIETGLTVVSGAWDVAQICQLFG